MQAHSTRCMKNWYYTGILKRKPNPDELALNAIACDCGADLHNTRKENEMLRDELARVTAELARWTALGDAYVAQIAGTDPLPGTPARVSPVDSSPEVPNDHL